MADRKLEIEFHKSMTADKRNTNFAYLRKNIADINEKGLYPAINFKQVEPKSIPVNGIIKHIAGNTRYSPTTTPLIIVETGSSAPYTYKFYQIGSSDTLGSDYNGDIIAFADAEYPYFVNDADNKVYYYLSGSVQSPSSNTFPSEPNVTIGIYDGLYIWWVGGKIWRYLSGSTPELMMENSGLALIDGVAWRDRLVFISRKSFQDGFDVFFYDKENIAYENRINFENIKPIKLAVIQDRLFLVYEKIKNQNFKEQESELIVSVFENGTFVKLNSIKKAINQDQPHYFIGRSFDPNSGSNDDSFIFGIRYNNISGSDLYKNYIYRIYINGSIEVLTNSDISNSQTSNSYHIKSFQLYDAYSIPGDGVSISPRIYINENDSSDYDDYDEYSQSEYITNFYANPYNEHRLDSLSISFEKLFKNSGSSISPEELDIYYRTSEREEWTLLSNITAQKIIDNVDLRQDYTTKNSAIPIKSQRYQITKMSDGTALPEFNEIQFKFIPKNGFSIIGAWFEYSYITRNTKK